MQFTDGIYRNLFELFFVCFIFGVCVLTPPKDCTSTLASNEAGVSNILIENYTWSDRMCPILFVGEEGIAWTCLSFVIYGIENGVHSAINMNCFYVLLHSLPRHF